MIPTKHSVRQALFVLAILAGPAGAAPADDAANEALPPAAQDSPAQIPIDRAAAPHINSGSRTVDLLIELQGKQAGLGIQATERAATRADLAPLRSELAGSLAGTPPSRASGTGLFDGGASPSPVDPSAALQAAQRGADWRAGQAHGGFADAPPRPVTTGLDYGRSGPLRMALSWLRENRAWVVGTSALLLLAVGWVSRRRARRR